MCSEFLEEKQTVALKDESNFSGTANDPTFRYNGFGTRVDRVVGSSVETWKRAGAGVTDSVLNDGVANFTPGISSRVGSTSTFTHAGLKNTGAQSEFSGTSPVISGTKTYDAFGLETNSTGTWKTAFGYAGNFGYQKTDAGLKLLGHRYYDPETGRFLSRDPIKDGRNWYGYGAGLDSPTMCSDPTGLSRFQGFKRINLRGGYSIRIDKRQQPKPNAHFERPHGGSTAIDWNGDIKPTHGGKPNPPLSESEKRLLKEWGGMWPEVVEPMIQIVASAVSKSAGMVLGVFFLAAAAGSAAADYAREHDDEWRKGIEEWYSRRGGFEGENVFSPGFLAGG